MASSINATEQSFQKERVREMCHSSLDTELEWEFKQILQASVSPPVKTTKGPGISDIFSLLAEETCDLKPHHSLPPLFLRGHTKWPAATPA